jgi:anti-sigma regulatory factor (Ser/Thr protein kinase)
MKEESKKQVFPAEVRRIPEMVSFVSKQALAAGIARNRIFNLELAVEEVFANICCYAYADGGAGQISISLNRDGQRLQMVIEDEGREFDPLQVPAPDLTVGLQQRKIGGLGIFLLRRMVDKIDYERKANSNQLRLVIGLT